MTVAKRKVNKGKTTGKGFRLIEEAGQGFEGVAVPRQNPNRPYRALPAIRPLKPKDPSRSRPRDVSRGRRVLKPYALEDPMEARAVPESVFAGTILERIQYKRNLVLFGAPGPLTWQAQVVDFRANSLTGGLRFDFVYYVCVPNLIIEPQGRFWHGPFARWGDESRAMVIRGLGYRYAELWEEDILLYDDEWLDRHILDLVGQRVLDTGVSWLTLPDRQQFKGVVTWVQLFKEEARNL